MVGGFVNPGQADPLIFDVILRAYIEQIWLIKYHLKLNFKLIYIDLNIINQCQITNIFLDFRTSSSLMIRSVIN